MIQRQPCLFKSSLTLLIIASFFPLWAAWQQSPDTLNDDSYITLTYAKNLAQGRGYVFNHPPPTQGTTTPLLTLILAGLAVILPQVSLPTLAIFFTTACWLGLVWTIFLFRKSWGLSPWQATLMGLILIATGWFSFLGMEAYLFAFLLMLSLSLFLQQGYLLAGLTAGLLFLTRGEGLLIIGIQGLFSFSQGWLRHKQLNLQIIKPALFLISGFLPPVCLWFIYAMLTFESLLPNTLAAKQAFLKLPGVRTLLTRLFDEWLPIWGYAFAWDKEGLYSFFNLWWILVIIGLGASLRQKRAWLILWVWVILYISGYTYLQVSAAWWYQLPILFACQICFALGLVQSVEYLKRIKKFPSLGLGFSICLVAFVLFTLGKTALAGVLTYTGDPRASSYHSLSQWIREHTDPSESIAYIEIGYLGYYTPNRIIDLLGLVLPDMIPYVRENDIVTGFWLYEPDYYIHVAHFDWALAEIRAGPRFKVMYEPVTTLAGPGEGALVVYKKVEVEN